MLAVEKPQGIMWYPRNLKLVSLCHLKPEGAGDGAVSKIRSKKFLWRGPHCRSYDLLSYKVRGPCRRGQGKETWELTFPSPSNLQVVIPIGVQDSQPINAAHIVSYWSTEKVGKGDRKGKLNPSSTICLLEEIKKKQSKIGDRIQNQWSLEKSKKNTKCVFS